LYLGLRVTPNNSRYLKTKIRRQCPRILSLETDLELQANSPSSVAVASNSFKFHHCRQPPQTKLSPQVEAPEAKAKEAVSLGITNHPHRRGTAGATEAPSVTTSSSRFSRPRPNLTPRPAVILEILSRRVQVGTSSHQVRQRMRLRTHHLVSPKF